MDDSRRLYTLDGLRGIAAIVVVFGHMPHTWTGSLNQFHHFYLAVDLFFMLSGFVIAFAYERRLEAEMTALQFMVARYIRLYPLYFLGTALGLVSGAFALIGGKGDLSGAGFLAATASSLLMLPSPTWNDVAELMPIDPPAWSLLYELAMNLIYAMILFRLPTRTIGVIVATAAAVLVFADFQSQTLHTGMTRKTIPFGLARVAFPYCMGILLFRLVSRRQITTWLAYALPFAAIPIWAGHASRTEFIELFGVIVFFPLLVAVGSRVEPLNPRVLQFLGGASYAIYVLSVPLITIVSRGLHLLHVDENYLTPWFGCVIIAGLLAVAALADRFFDVPVRRSLTRTFLGSGATHRRVRETVVIGD